MNLPPDQAERLDLRGTIQDLAPPPPADDELIKLALDCRPDVAAYRSGIEVAEANVELQRRNRFQDAYFLYQPFTYQNNAPYGRQSGASWALGITVPVPVFNRNQGNIERAMLNVRQSQLERMNVERRAITDVQLAVNDYRVSGEMVRRMRNEVLPPMQRSRDDRFHLLSTARRLFSIT